MAVRAQQEGLAFRDALLAEPRVVPHLSRAALDELLDPATYLGLAPALVDGVVGAA